MLAIRLGALSKTVIGRVLVPGSDFAFGGEPVDVARFGVNHVKSSCLLWEFCTPLPSLFTYRIYVSALCACVPLPFLVRLIRIDSRLQVLLGKLESAQMSFRLN